MYSLSFSKQFRKDYKKILKNAHFHKIRFEEIINPLLNEQPLPLQYRNHYLMGQYTSCCECHIQPDVLLIYEVDRIKRIVYLFRIGSHSELFG